MILLDICIFQEFAGTCVAGFLYLMLVVPGKAAAMLSSSTEPSSSTDTSEGSPPSSPQTRMKSHILAAAPTLKHTTIQLRKLTARL